MYKEMISLKVNIFYRKKSFFFMIILISMTCVVLKDKKVYFLGSNQIFNMICISIIYIIQRIVVVKKNNYNKEIKMNTHRDILGNRQNLEENLNFIKKIILILDLN